METVIELCECHLMPLMILAFFLASFAECLMEWAMESGWRRKNLKFISDDDITVLNDYLEEDRCYSDIGEIISNAYRKDKELKRIRKGWWKKLWKKSKDKEQ